MVLFKQARDFPLLRWGEGFCLGMIAMLIAAVFTPPEIVRVPVLRIVEKPVVVKQPYYLNAYDRKQIACMATNTYHEAGNQSMKGKIAVNNVVMNRVKDPRFPNTPCAVVYEKTGGTCQFSWVCEGNKTIRNRQMYAASKYAAEQVYLKNVGDVTNGAKFYHATYVNPDWGFKKIAQIGAHIFYRG